MSAPKLIVLPGSTDTLGGTLITLSFLIKGFKSLGVIDHLSVLTRTGSLMESYLQEMGLEACLLPIDAPTEKQFVQQALRWIQKQPHGSKLLFFNCVAKELMPSLILAAPRLRWQRYSLYSSFHDLALSRNYFGYLLRKIAFTLLAPVSICNSDFTAKHIKRFVPKIVDICHPPVDVERFSPFSYGDRPPENLQAVLKTGARVILTPSRINQPGIINDKNLRSLIPVVAQLKARGHFYHSVVIGEDRSPGQRNTQALLESACAAGVADRFTVLPPTRQIEDYYRHSDVVVTLAPREPFGRTVVEAIACGVPVVGSQTGGVAEILSHFAPEWTVDLTDPAAVAETIIQVQTHPQTQSRLAAGQRWVAAECNPVNYARKFMKVVGIESVQGLSAQNLKVERSPVQTLEP